MLTLGVFVLWTWVLEAVKHSTVMVAIVTKTRSFASFMAIGIEGHLALVYLYPITYPVLDLISYKTGVDLSGFKYGHGSGPIAAWVH